MMHVLDCTLKEALKALKHEIVLHLMLATPELIWLHAGAVTQGDGALLFVGKWGAGKSTLVTGMYEMGWAYMSDDMIPFHPERGTISAFPLTPARRVSEEKDSSLEDITGLQKEDVLLESGRVWQANQEIKAIIFPAYKKDAKHSLIPVTPAVKILEIVRQCQNIEHHGEQAIKHLNATLGPVPAYRLEYSNAKAAINAILGMI